jgi:hypothetical protein
MAQDSPGEAQTKNPADALWSGKLQEEDSTKARKDENTKVELS